MSSRKSWECNITIGLYDELLSFCEAILTETKIPLFLMDDLGHPFLFLEDFMEKDFDAILKTEYSNRFDEIRKKQMITSFYKYGALKDNYQKFKCMKALEDVQLRIQKYKETGNTEFLADAANFLMIEFMYPSIAGAKYTPTHSGACEIAGFSINEIREGKA